MWVSSQLLFEEQVARGDFIKIHLVHQMLEALLMVIYALVFWSFPHGTTSVHSTLYPPPKLYHLFCKLHYLPHLFHNVIQGADYYLLSPIGTRPDNLQDHLSLWVSVHPTKSGTIGMFKVSCLKGCHILVPGRCAFSITSPCPAEYPSFWDPVDPYHLNLSEGLKRRFFPPGILIEFAQSLEVVVLASLKEISCSASYF